MRRLSEACAQYVRRAVCRHARLHDLGSQPLSGLIHKKAKDLEIQSLTPPGGNGSMET